MANKILGKKSEQKEAWEEVWNSAWHIYFIDEKLRPGGREKAGGNNSYKVLISIRFPGLMIEHDFLNSGYQSPKLNYVAEDLRF